MNVRNLMMAFIWVFIPVSIVQAADIMKPHQSQSYQPVPLIASSSSFSWTGFYFGGQIGGFSGEATLKDKNDASEDSKLLSPELSGFIGGVYAGSNVGLGKDLILGIDTDMVWSGKKYTKVVNVPGDIEKVTYRFIKRPNDRFDYVLKEKWAGATRMRVGFIVDRVMPYVSGGVSYVQLQSVFEVKSSNTQKQNVGINEVKLDETKILVGYSIGGGIDVAMTDNVVMRAEYRYSDFGKKKFAEEDGELSYKTNDFRVGVAYKF
ncbi:outer membrane protein [Bartonella sp. AR 15-3]|uniref:outer membrane protein n=1 Tax=Bartonella sp. AR 15-3 TaxID=545617 RepID=UPI0001F4BF77|nr:outer membrane protein [Bartonella sp. AR 15-3]OPB31130.1 outer membrane immunogenic protein [Bartonella sp. AR 15-3]CBI78745.1 Hemin binding protein d [Bartonella sp. AR 15-3]